MPISLGHPPRRNQAAVCMKMTQRRRWWFACGGLPRLRSVPNENKCPSLKPIRERRISTKVR
jgi:hypothetical protein